MGINYPLKANIIILAHHYPSSSIYCSVFLHPLYSNLSPYHIPHVCRLFFYPGLSEALPRRPLHGVGRSSPLLTALPLSAGHPVRRLLRAHHGPLHLGSRSQVSPRALCVRLLSAAAQPRHLQGAAREAVLLALLRQGLCVRHTQCITQKQNHIQRHFPKDE